MEFITIGNIWIAFIIIIAIICIHLLSLCLAKLLSIKEEKIVSFSGGLSSTYVFLHMLPQLVEGNEAIGKVLAKKIHLTPLFDLSIFIVAFFGFNLYYGFELLAIKYSKKNNSSSFAYRLHLFIYCIFNFIIAYTMPLRVQTGIAFSIVFTFAIGMHYILSDRNFQKHFPDKFAKSGRLFLVFSLLLGWFVSAITDPINVFHVSLFIAFLSGSILLNVFKALLPSDSEQNYFYFLSGTLLMTTFLVVLTLLK